MIHDDAIDIAMWFTSDRQIVYHFVKTLHMIGLCEYEDIGYIDDELTAL